MQNLRLAKKNAARIVAEKAELEEKIRVEAKEKEDQEASALEILEKPVGTAISGAVADAVNDLRVVDFFDGEGNQNTVEIAACLRQLCLLASPANILQFYDSDVCTVVALQMRLHINQVVAVVQAYEQVNASKKTKNIKLPPPPVDNGVALYGCGLFDRLIPIDRHGKMRAKLLDKNVDAPAILRLIMKYYPFQSGSYMYASRALSKLGYLHRP